jgi:serine/threonine-protein kinase
VSAKPFQPGDSFDRYTIEALVGEGGMGKVYRAYDPRLQRRVALKVLRVEKSDDGERGTDASARMMREARAAAALEHANCVAIFDVGEVNGTRFIAMEYVDGSSLRDFIGDPSVPLDQKIRWLVDVARALGAAHARGLIHRDVKPENVMVREDGTVKVLDFGIAKRALGEGAPGEAREGSTLGRAAEREDGDVAATLEGVISGTPQYMAPEQIRGEVLDGRADQFAWGLLAYELITGQHPWHSDESGNRVLLGILNETPRPPQTYVPTLPALVSVILMKALAKERADRFVSMHNVVAALEPWAVAWSRRASPAVTSGIEMVMTEPATPIVATPAPPPPIEPAPRPRRRWITAIAGVTAAAALAVGLTLGARHAPSRSSDDAGSAAGIAMTAVELPSTAHADALAAYKAGLQAFRDASFEPARQSFARAAQIDPALGSAHLRLAVMASLMTNETEAREEFQRAVQYRAGLPARDAALLDALEPYLQREPSDLGESEKRLRDAVARYPSDAEIRLYLGTVQFDRGNAREASATFDEALALDPQFAEAWSYRGATSAFLGDFDAALVALDRCLGMSLGATDCLWYRVLIHEDQGKCAQLEADARTWIAKSPGDATGYHMLAKALLAMGRDEGTVRVALDQKWARLTGEQRRRNELVDLSRLDVLHGDFTSALLRSAELEKRLSAEPMAGIHARLAADRVALDGEIGREADAAHLADDFMKRRDAWVPPTRVDDIAISTDRAPVMLAAQHAAGLLTPSAFEERRAEWLRSWEAKTSPTYRGFLWIYGYAEPARTREDATAAIAALSRYEPLPAFTSASLAAEAEVGKVYWLAGRPNEARLQLERATRTCAAIEEPFAHTIANLNLGLTREALGDPRGACAAYKVVVDRWGSAKPNSRSAATARERISQLRCGR